jgi:hypothetical protein
MLPRLNADPNATVDVQQTQFSHDVVGVDEKTNGVRSPGAARRRCGN